MGITMKLTARSSVIVFSGDEFLRLVPAILHLLSGELVVLSFLFF